MAHHLSSHTSSSRTRSSGHTWLQRDWTVQLSCALTTGSHATFTCLMPDVPSHRWCKIDKFRHDNLNNLNFLFLICGGKSAHKSSSNKIRSKALSYIIGTPSGLNENACYFILAYYLHNKRSTHFIHEHIWKNSPGGRVRKANSVWVQELKAKNKVGDFNIYQNFLDNHCNYELS